MKIDEKKDLSQFVKLETGSDRYEEGRILVGLGFLIKTINTRK